MRTPQDIINRKEANQRYYKLEENKEQKRNYMKIYREKKKRGASNELLHAENTERFKLHAPSLKPQASKASSRKPQAPSTKVQASSRKRQARGPWTLDKVSRTSDQGA